MTLEEILIELERYGRPTCGKIHSGWYCDVEMNVSAAGVKFDIKSEYGHLAPIYAAIECLERLRAVVGDLKQLPAA